jgi:hypothetical protein
VSDPQINVRITEVTVCAVPEDSINHSTYAITVAWRGGEKHAVVRHRQCLGADGQWDFEPSPSNRDEEWIATHRFDYATALALAVKAAPDVRVNGRTATQVAEDTAP